MADSTGPAWKTCLLYSLPLKAPYAVLRWFFLICPLQLRRRWEVGGSGPHELCALFFFFFFCLCPILEKPGFAHLFTHLLEPTELQLDRQIHPFIDLGPGHSQKVGLAVPLRRCLRRDAKDSGSAEFSGISTTLRALGHMVSLGRIKEVQPPPWRTIPPSAVNLDLPHTQKALRSEVCRNLSNEQSNPFC